MNNEDTRKIDTTEMSMLMHQLFPICRSITGNGVRETLKILQNLIPLQVMEVPTGTAVFDWTVPKEWNIKDAYIKNSKNEKIVDFKKCSLHVMSYSIPIHKKLPLSELKEHLHTYPELPDAIPYITSYYKENWGFCMAHQQYEQLKEETYEVVIDSTLESGHLTYGEYVIPGETKEEVLISCYICHPSMCNDSLSGVVVAAKLAQAVTKKFESAKPRYTYRFLFIPETIGAITWLSKNKNNTDNISHGIVLTCIGDKGNLTYKRSRKGNTMIDKIMEKVLKDEKVPHTVIDFFPNGSDERQFCSPGFNLPVGSLMRTAYGKYPEYHSSADNFTIMSEESLEQALHIMIKAVDAIESNKVYINTNPFCEPNLGKRNLYPAIGAGKKSSTQLEAIKWVLNFSDGQHDLIDIAIRSGMTFSDIAAVIPLLREAGLLKEK
ncbi:MAG TPA: DUF4910 domain-containing protein [Candidatus Nanoarchaeia archaeon]|nr:DUF4910 domain-containing protein [Candidatus Nanoarchaeia archaeon]